jgi:phage terminase large subunit-like protein
MSFDRWRADPVRFITEALCDPETEQPFELNPSQRAFLAKAFELDDHGRLKHPELLYSAPKKSGKTALAAMVVLTVTLVLGGKHAEAICCANDIEQAQSRVFASVRRIVEASPLLRSAASITASKISFPELGASIEAIASDYTGAAGSNAVIVSFDELWGYTSERSRRLWDELIPPPTRKIACRLTTTYAGFEGESALLEGLQKRGLALPLVGRDLHAGDGLLMFWSHEPVAPWQTEEWIEQMRSALRPNAFLRLIENRFVTSESNFVDLSWWDDCIDPDMRPFPPRMAERVPVFMGIDASVKHDSTAVVAVTWDKQLSKARLAAHQIFYPRPDSPLDFEATIERAVENARANFQVCGVYYDPYQMAAVAQRLRQRGVPMREYPQTPANLTMMGQNLYELIRSRGIVAYPDDEIRLAVSRTISKETPRGYMLTKEKASHKIDVVIALAMAAQACVSEGQHRRRSWRRSLLPRRLARRVLIIPVLQVGAGDGRRFTERCCAVVEE